MSCSILGVHQQTPPGHPSVVVATGTENRSGAGALLVDFLGFVFLLVRPVYAG